MINKQLLSSLKKKKVKVIAVSKTKSTTEIMEVYDAGHKAFGENKVQEMLAKHEALPKDIKWHMIGHLQKNKVKHIAPFIHMIHSVDSLELLETINKFGKQNDRVINILLQIRIAKEDTKFGMSPETIYPIVEQFTEGKFPNVKICGLMGMASFTDDDKQLNLEFGALHDIYIEMKEVYFHRSYYFKEISMGMSNDYEIAMENGATMLRIGTLIFGQRF